MNRCAVAAFSVAVMASAVPAHAQTASQATVSAVCGTQVYPVGSVRPVVQTAAGEVCTDTSGGVPTTQDVNVKQVGGVPVAAPTNGAGATDSTTQRTVTATDSPDVTNLASILANFLAQASTTSGQTGILIQCAATTSAPSYTTSKTNPLNCNLSGGLRVDGSAVTQPISAASLPLPSGAMQQTGGVVGLAAGTTGGCTPYHLAGGTTASTNSTAIKASAAGTLCSVTAVSVSGTLAYLRIYDSAAAPTCSSATGAVLTIPVPANTSGAGVSMPLGPFGVAFTNGIGFCVTGGGTDTDNTNAPTGIYIDASTK